MAWTPVPGTGSAQELPFIGGAVGWFGYDLGRRIEHRPATAADPLGLPELFLRVRGGEVETSPIKGTAPRGATTAEDLALAEALRCSLKDRAENLMIKDLLRNDLGRTCAISSVRVDALFELQTFANLHHLVSTLRGRLAAGQDALSLLKGAFPGGSITGAPKIRAMEIIEELDGSGAGFTAGPSAILGSMGPGIPASPSAWGCIAEAGCGFGPGAVSWLTRTRIGNGQRSRSRPGRCCIGWRRSGPKLNCRCRPRPGAAFVAAPRRDGADHQGQRQSCRGRRSDEGPKSPKRAALMQTPAAAGPSPREELVSQ